MQLILDRASLEQLLGFHINDPRVYQHAFVHKSAVRLCEERGLPAESYELYEFLGDAAINLVVTKYVFEQARQRGEQEGWATKMRTRLVSGQCLSKLSRALNLQDAILMNSKAMANGWNNNDRILEDCFEALVGCVYLDVSLAAARAFVLSTIERFIDLSSLEADNNFKDIIMRWSQAKGMPLPVYKHIEAIQDGSKVFVTHCYVNGQAMGYGRHKSKKQGEQMAARQAMHLLDGDN
ncbi:ribonuclease III domain-containing protein [Scenedesmus sp. NREL 46B-D3]|nr:ribonuclease III domain-containing protein [Scenedesmus sp. NREL 46B-D3]